MLKQRMHVPDDEEEDDDIPYRPWFEPTAIDFSRIPHEVRDKNYVTRGGNVSFHTDEQKSMEEREKRVLMAIYTDPRRHPAHAEVSAPDRHDRHGRRRQGGTPPAGRQVRGNPPSLEGVPAVRPGRRSVLRHEAAGREGRPGLQGELDSRHAEILVGHAGRRGARRPRPGPGSPADAGAPDQGPRGAAWGASRDEQVPRSARGPTRSGAGRTPTRPTADASRQSNTPTRRLQLAARIVEGISNYLKAFAYPAAQPPDWLADDAERVREWWAGVQKDAAQRAKREAEERMRARSRGHRPQDGGGGGGGSAGSGTRTARGGPGPRGRRITRSSSNSSSTRSTWRSCSRYKEASSPRLLLRPPSPSKPLLLRERSSATLSCKPYWPPSTSRAKARRRRRRRSRTPRRISTSTPTTTLISSC